MASLLVKRKSSPAIIIDAGDDAPIEDTDIAIQKMKNCGFDDLNKDNINRGMILFMVGSKYCEYWVTPMSYFVIKGDLKMCRFLFVNYGAKCTQTTDDGGVRQFPLYYAVREGNLDLCQWLCKHGAKEDIQRRNPPVGTPLQNTTLTRCCCYTKGYLKKKFNIVQRLILNGSLCCQDNDDDVDDDCQIDEVILKRDLSVDSRPMILSWAQEELKIRNNFLFFLYGTSQHKQHHIFNGNKSGIMENIADYTGIVRGRDLRIIRQLSYILSTLIHQEDAESSS